MNIETLIKDKAIKPKEKTETISRWLLEDALSIDELVDYAIKSKDPVKATCIEAIEFATKQHPSIANEKVLVFVTNMLAEKAPRVKWESAKVIGNIAGQFAGQLDTCISGLLSNTEHEGTVVRWSAAYALGEILKLRTKHNAELLPAIEAICAREEKKSICKIYLSAIKALK